MANMSPKKNPMPTQQPSVRAHNFSEVAQTYTKEEAVREASRCLECGCSSVYDCELLPLARKYDALSNMLGGKSRQYVKDKSHPFIERDNNKCILCGQCVRACREISQTENLGLFGRGFGTVPVTAFDLPLGYSKCISCGACVNACPVGAIKDAGGKYEIDENACVSCGTCAGDSPVGDIVEG